MHPLNSRSARLCGAVLLALSLPLIAQTLPDAAPAAEPAPAAPAIAKDDPAILDAEMQPRASHALLLDIVQTASGLFAVGERGQALTSSDGKTWTQLKIPTRSALTAITAADGQLWAGGHDGVIIHSADGGQTWKRQRVAPWSADDQDPSHGVPVLDILFTDATHGVAVGAYSLMLVTEDAGVTWTPRKVSIASAPAAAPKDDEPKGDDWTFSNDQLALGDESDPHFNAIARTGSGAMVIVGERGAFLRSTDGGVTWAKGKFPYQGSMFGVLSWDGDHILAFGLRGNVFESSDLGNSWRKVATGGNVSLLGGQALPNGGAVLVGANGLVLTRKDGDSPFVATTFTNAAGEIPVLAGVQSASPGNYVLIGDKGADLYLPK